MLDAKTPINATLALQANRNAAADAMKLAAERRMQAELLAFNDAFDHPTTRTT
jgi:hypothetical protein